MKKQKIQTMYNIDDLNYLKNLFYKFEKLEDVNSEKLNKSLNLFYGLKSVDNEDWKEEFKDSIKRKAEKSKEGKQKFINVSPKDFEIIEAKEIFKQAFLKKNSIKQQLKSLYANKSTFKSTIIYEAPPYLLSIMEKDGALNNEFVAEFILDDKCSSPYSNAIRGCFNNEATRILDILTKNDCGFFDVIPIPLPINSNLRNQWATEEKFVINGKRIFVHFFEWAIENYIIEVKISKGEKHKIAIGIPLNNAITLYEHFAPTKIVEFGNHKIIFNDPHTIDLINKKSGLWIHPFKNCVISTSNTPNAELMKLAFDK